MNTCNRIPACVSPVKLLPGKSNEYIFTIVGTKQSKLRKFGEIFDHFKLSLQSHQKTLKSNNSNCFLSCKDKTPDEYKNSVVYEFSCPGCRSTYIGKTDRCLYTRLKEHSTRENSVINAHINYCEHFQHIKSLMELSPDSTNPINTNLTELIFRNCKIIDRSDHWSLLLFKESLAIRRRKPDLNHGTKASKELIIFH